MELGTLQNGLRLFYLNWGETRFLYDEIFEANSYLRHGIELHDGDTVVDVGANIGLFDLFLHQKWPGIRLFSFEPIPEIFAVLCANVRLHGMNARAFDVALADRVGTAEFTFYPNNSVMSGRYADHSEDVETTRAFIGNRDPAFASQAQEDPDFAERANDLLERLFERRTAVVNLRPLSEIVAAEGIDQIDLLKIDAEKSEHEVLAGLTDADWPRVRQIVIEVHDFDGRLRRIQEFLREKGFRLQVEQDPLLRSTAIFDLYGTARSPG